MDLEGEAEQVADGMNTGTCDVPDGLVGVASVEVVMAWSKSCEAYSSGPCAQGVARCTLAIPT